MDLSVWFWLSLTLAALLVSPLALFLSPWYFPVCLHYCRPPSVSLSLFPSLSLSHPLWLTLGPRWDDCQTEPFNFHSDPFHFSPPGISLHHLRVDKIRAAFRGHSLCERRLGRTAFIHEMWVELLHFCCLLYGVTMNFCCFNVQQSTSFTICFSTYNWKYLSMHFKLLYPMRLP